MSENNNELHPFRVFYATYQTKLTKKFMNRKVWEQPDPTKVLSYIPGTITGILAKEGDQLKEGDPLLIFEAMKMENTICMPYNGSVKKYNVEIGQKFPKEYVLVEIEYSGEE